MKGWKKIFHANGKQKTAGVAILISDKVKNRQKTQRHCIITKGSIYKEDIQIENMYVPKTNIRVPKYIKQILTKLKGETDSNTIVTSDFNTPLSIMERTSRQEINKEKENLNTIDQG